MNDIKKNMRWLSIVLVLMFFGTVFSVMIGHAVTYIKPKQTAWYNNQVLQTKPFRIQI
jgi:hypothetical protein